MDYVEKIDCPVICNQSFYRSIFHQLHGLNLIKAPYNMVQYAWISLTNIPYGFGGKVFQARPMTEYQHLSKLMDEISQICGYTLDSCLVSYYHDGLAATPLHSDDEKSLDPNSPTCNVSIGSERTIDFCDINTKHKLCSFNSLYRFSIKRCG